MLLGLASSAMAHVLQDRIQVLALQFAAQVLAELRGASLEDILDGSGNGRRRAPPARPPYSDRGNGTEADIVALVKKFKHGVGAGIIRAELGLSPAQFHFHVTKALKANVMRKTGQKRGTTYYPA